MPRSLKSQAPVSESTALGVYLPEVSLQLTKPINVAKALQLGSQLLALGKCVLWQRELAVRHSCPDQSVRLLHLPG